MITTDMSQYLDVFLDEGREQLVLLETNILEMERGNHTKEMLQILFRAAHTLKGSSRAMGFLAIGDLTHEMENILDDLRNDLLEVTTPIVNALLDCLDSLGGLVDTVAESGTDTGTADQKIPALVARLNALRTGSVPTGKSEDSPVTETSPSAPSAPQEAIPSFALSDHEQFAVDAAMESDLPIYLISMTLSEDCMLKSVRVWMTLSALEPLGTVVAAEPSEEKLEAEDFELSFRLLLASSSSLELVEQALKTVSEVDKCEVSVWTPPADETDSPAPLALATPPAAPAQPEAPMAELPAAIVTPTEPTPETTSKPAAANKAPAATQTIRVEVSRLDNLLNLVGELVIERAQVHQICADLHRRYPRDEEAAQLLETTHRIARVTGELQDQIMKTRMLSIDGVFQRMPRMVRDLAQKTGKDVRFEMYGGETELDRTVLESLGDPLIHLLRNSVDHGVETPETRSTAGKPTQGLVTLSARHEQNHIVIEITDDGAGIDPSRLKESAIRKGLVTPAAAGAMSDRDAINLIFASGFSTAATLSDISGRGVGMDIVKSNLEKIGGRVVVESIVGKGSQFTITLPLTLAIVRAVLVESGGGTYVLPLGNVVEMLRLGTSEGDTHQRTLGGQAVISLRGRTIPLAYLSDLLAGNPGATQAAQIPKQAFVVVVGIGDRQIGLCVDALVGEQEVVIKSMGTLLGDIPGLSGATILGDGEVALIVDVTKASERIQSIERLHPTEQMPSVNRLQKEAQLAA